jgi:cytochrome c-type biogenesis protein CcmF
MSQKIEYLNEHLLPGQLGNFFVVLSFIASLFAAYAFYQSTKSGDWKGTTKSVDWKGIARKAFLVHGISVFGIFAMLLVILFGHYFEYYYAWDHLNNAMPMKYVFSCLWEGQEGSFLLWTFWHVILGFCLMRWSKEWEPWVMTVLSVVQVFLASMLLGVFFGDFQFGSNPFLLMREHPKFYGLPWTLNADYLSLARFKDGQGLNALLQNYWMTIHPPTLFLGFASTVIPFAYAIAGLWRKDLKGWMRPAIPYAFFGVMILGTGILMGGAWAYEALGFGGFWAWDPVENASLVPWLILVGAAHLLVINQGKPTSLFPALLLSLSSFILILYSTFLTRSGVLGDSSVHSFVDSGILAQLLVYLLFFVTLSTYLMIGDKKWKIAYSAICGVLFLIALGNLLTYHSDLTQEQLEKLLPGEDTYIPGLVVIFILVSAFMLIIAYRKNFRQPESTEEALWSREFWMFIGTLILCLSALHITFVTSLNVGNILLSPFEGIFQSLHEKTGWDSFKKLAEHSYSSPGGTETFQVYHKVQVPLAFLLFIIVASGQFLKYKQTDMKVFFRKIVIAFVVSLAAAVALAFAIDFEGRDISLLLLVWACFFAVAANLDYGFRVLKGKLDLMGASVAHLGFAMLIIGAVVSTWQSYFISKNEKGDITQLNAEFKNNEDMLILMGDTLPMGDYFVSYKDKYREGEHVKCTVEYFEMLPKNYKKDDYVEVMGTPFRATQDHVASSSFLKDATEDKFWTQITPAEAESEEAEHSMKNWMPGTPGKTVFTLEPSILIAPKGNSREPSIAHFAGHDIYTFIKHTEVDIKKDEESGYLEPISGIIGVNQLVKLSPTVDFKIDRIEEVTGIPDSLPQGMIAKRAFVTLTDGQDKENMILSMVMSKDSVPFVYPSESKMFKMLLALKDTPGGVELTIQKHSSTEKDMLIMSAKIFPQINILWLGCLVMVIGTVMAIRHRIKIFKLKKGSEEINLK